MNLEYPHIVASTKTAIHMTHDVCYQINASWRRDDWNEVRRTAMMFEAEYPSNAEVERVLRIQLGIAAMNLVRIVSVSPFTGYSAAE